MRPNAALRLFCFLLCLGSSLSSVLCCAAERPNVVWLISEDNSVHYLKLFDEHGAETPNIAKLAESGLLFRNAFSNAPVCSVARTTLMTGCYAPRIGTQFHRRSVVVPMPPGLKMFPAYLREAGYYTTNRNKKDYNAQETPGTWDESSRKATWRNRSNDQPFFHMQSFTASHESSLHFSQEVYETKPTETDPSSVFVAPYHPQTDLFRYTVAKYHDNIRKIDREIGAVVDQLREDQLLDDTFVFYFGDHGGVLPRGKGYAYESGLHVPLVVHIPKNFQHLAPMSPAKDVDGFVQFVDFGATVLNLAGLEIPQGIDGKPFLGEGVEAEELNARNEAWGYADRFDEKYDLVRTLRRGRYEYVRSYQPFNMDGLQNNYRFIMLAYREWRTIYNSNRDSLTPAQRAFFESRPVEMLFDIEQDPHEVNDLAQDPNYAEVLLDMRQRMQNELTSWPDLSFYPESVLVEEAFQAPVPFGQEHQAEIQKLLAIADLSLMQSDGVASAQEALLAALKSKSAVERYWGLIACTCFGETALASSEIEPLVKACLKDEDVLVRTRATECLALHGKLDPAESILDCLSLAESGVQANLILNSAVLLRDGDPGFSLSIREQDVPEEFRDFQDVQRRLSYFAAPDGIPKKPRGK